MTFGIDVSANNGNVNWAAMKSTGVQFPIIKAAGFNVTPMYSADNYHTNVDHARAAGFSGLGHYYVTGKGDPVKQADFFANNLYKFVKSHDILALDNEVLNDNGAFWKQSDVMKFFTELVKKTGIAWNHLWLYCPASLTRSNGPWDQVTDKGVRIWWSSYGENPNSRTPDHTPDLQGKIARWDVHQFTSNLSIGGLSELDANYSKLSMTTLFGTAAPKPSPTPPNWSFVEPPKQMQARIQRALGARNRYNGPADGVWGTESDKGIQLTLKSGVNYTGPIDGNLKTSEQCLLIQTYAKNFGSYAGPLDRKLGDNTWAGFALGLERP